MLSLIEITADGVALLETVGQCRSAGAVVRDLLPAGVFACATERPLASVPRSKADSQLRALFVFNDQPVTPIGTLCFKFIG
jgi:hypothetical protein